jgi:hypothetical protein
MSRCSMLRDRSASALRSVGSGTIIEASRGTESSVQRLKILKVIVRILV